MPWWKSASGARLDNVQLLITGWTDSMFEYDWQSSPDPAVTFSLMRWSVEMCLAHGMRMCDLSGFIQVGLWINYPMQKDNYKIDLKGTTTILLCSPMSPAANLLFCWVNEQCVQCAYFAFQILSILPDWIFIIQHYSTWFNLLGSTYIYAFSRCFYPKPLTVHSGYTFFANMYVCFLRIEPTTC